MFKFLVPRVQDLTMKKHWDWHTVRSQYHEELMV